MAGSGAVSGFAVALTREDCLRRVAAATYGRIIYTQGALPAVLPVTFTLDDDRVVFDVEPTSALANAYRAAVLTFHVDDADLSNRTAWSVTITGRADLHGGERSGQNGGPTVGEFAPVGNESAPVGSEPARLALTAERVVGYRTTIYAPTR